MAAVFLPTPLFTPLAIWHGNQELTHILDFGWKYFTRGMEKKQFPADVTSGRSNETN